MVVPFNSVLNGRTTSLSISLDYGTVGRVSIATDRDTGQQRGFGFVEMNVDAGRAWVWGRNAAEQSSPPLRLLYFPLGIRRDVQMAP
jgi:hypothetical protein